MPVLSVHQESEFITPLDIQSQAWPGHTVDIFLYSFIEINEAHIQATRGSSDLTSGHKMTAVHADSAMLTAGSVADEINDFPPAKLIDNLGDMSAFSEDGESDRDSGVGASLLNTSLHWSSGESSEDELPAIGCRCLLHFGVGNQDDFDDGYADNSDVDFDRDIPVGDEGSDNVPVLKGDGDEDELDGRRYHGMLKYLRRSRTAFESLPVRSRNLRPHICRICSRVVSSIQNDFNIMFSLYA